MYLEKFSPAVKLYLCQIVINDSLSFISQKNLNLFTDILKYI